MPLIEVMSSILFGTGITAGGMHLYKRYSKERVCPFGTLSWGIFTGSGFKCPKCTAVMINNNQGNICDCHDYPKEHFHFKCKDCKYKNILRTQDDS